MTFQKVPFETLLDARERSRKTMRDLAGMLLATYISAFIVLAFALFYIPVFYADAARPPAHIVLGGATALAVFIAGCHIHSARSKTLAELMARLRAMHADRKDALHRRFINIVDEIEIALSQPSIRAVIIPSVGCNACSIQASDESAICITEGLLAKLTRAELSAVIAQQAAHIVDNSARTMTIAAALFSVFDTASDAVEENLDAAVHSGMAFAGVAIIWVIALIGQVIIHLLSVAISRENQFSADALAIRITLDPMALANALHKLSSGYRGALGLPVSCAPLCIVSPLPSRLDEDDSIFARLFGTHPPPRERIERIARWSRAHPDRRKSTAVPVAPPAMEETSVYYQLYTEDGWVGPYTHRQLLVLDGFSPMSWICPQGTEQVIRAGADQLLSGLFAGGAPGRERCPRCNVSLAPLVYEGAPIQRCAFCLGHLLPEGALEKIIARREVGFTAKQIADAKRRPRRKTGSLIPCPRCPGKMEAGFHSWFTKIVIWRCRCGAIWCDAGDLEQIQIVIEEAGKSAAV